MSSFPTKAQVKRAVEAAEAAGIEVSAVRVGLDGVTVFASQAPLLAFPLPPGEGEPNDFDE